MRVQSDETANAKIFAEFVALIVQCRIYTLLKGEMEGLDKKLNYMTIPAAICEQKKKELFAVVEKRSKSYEEIMEFLTAKNE